MDDFRILENLFEKHDDEKINSSIIISQKII